MKPFGSPKEFRKKIGTALGSSLEELEPISHLDTASVLLPIQWEAHFLSGPVILLNKRSRSVRQPGDLCCPGGRVDNVLDGLLGRLLRLPFSPLPRSAAWRKYTEGTSGGVRKLLSVFWAACLRESWEEMGLLPWKVEFLGVLPLYRLRLFQRRILPMAGWIQGQTRFRCNWEVERILRVPLQELINPLNYVAYKIKNHPIDGENIFPAYLHEEGQEKEILWGATYWIVESFLRSTLGFQSPEMESRPLVEGSLAQNYLNAGRRNRRNKT